MKLFSRNAVCVLVLALSSLCGRISTAADPVPLPTPLLPRITNGPVRAELQQIASGVTAPNELLTTSDGRLFINQQSGTIRIVKDNVLLPTPFIDVSARLIAGTGERGLLGLAFHPGYNDPASPGYQKFYTYTSEPITGAADFTVPKTTAFDHQSVVAEWQASAADPDVADPATRRELLRIDEPQANHNGGQLAFRPGENYLYIALGDGGNGNDVGDGHSAIGNGQDLTTVLGKILRISPLDPALTSSSGDPVSANGKYRVPASNPFVSSTTTVHEIFAYGFRNPFRFSFDSVTGQLLAGDVGQGNVEEVDIVTSGKNYGWNRKEGSFLFNPVGGTISVDTSPDPSLTDPSLEYSHEDGVAIIGGFVAHGSSVPALSGLYVFGDFIAPGTSSGRLFYSDVASGVIQELPLGDPEHDLGILIKGFGRDDAGDIYVVGDGAGVGGVVYKLVSIPAKPAILNLSTRLNVGTGDTVLIGGFIISGSASEQVVLRGIGPSLTSGEASLPGALPNPKLELYDSKGTLLASNDDWVNSDQQDELANLGLAPTDSLEAAILTDLAPGAYTTILSGSKGGTGIGLVELYAPDNTATAKPLNISSRGLVQTGDNVMIGGFIIGGTDTRHVLVRAIGPSLSTSGVANPLLDPTLELHDQNGALLFSNNNWRDSQEADISATGLAPTDDRESAIVMDLAPSNYTAIVRGNNGGAGVGLVEAYDIP